MTQSVGTRPSAVWGVSEDHQFLRYRRIRFLNENAWCYCVAYYEQNNAHYNLISTFIAVRDSLSSSILNQWAKSRSSLDIDYTNYDHDNNNNIEIPLHCDMCRIRIYRKIKIYMPPLMLINIPQIILRPHTRLGCYRTLIWPSLGTGRPSIRLIFFMFSPFWLRFINQTTSSRLVDNILR